MQERATSTNEKYEATDGYGLSNFNYRTLVNNTASFVCL